MDNNRLLEYIIYGFSDLFCINYQPHWFMELMALEREREIGLWIAHYLRVRIQYWDQDGRIMGQQQDNHGISVV